MKISFRKLSNINNIPIIVKIGTIIFIYSSDKLGFPTISFIISGLSKKPNTMNIAPEIIFKVFSLVVPVFFKNKKKSKKGINEVPKKNNSSIKFGKFVITSINTIKNGIMPAK